MPKLFTKIETVDPYGKTVTIYRDTRGNIEVTHIGKKDGWFVKLKHKYGIGNDEAINISSESAKALRDILIDINSKDIRNG